MPLPLLRPLLLPLLRPLLPLLRAAAASAAAGGGLGLALPAGAAAEGRPVPEGRGGVPARGLLLPAVALLLMVAPLLLPFLRVAEDEGVVCLFVEGWLVLLLPLLPGLWFAGVAGAQLEGLLLSPAWLPSSEFASSVDTERLLPFFCFMLHRVCTRDEDFLAGLGASSSPRCELPLLDKKSRLHIRFAMLSKQRAPIVYRLLLADPGLLRKPRRPPPFRTFFTIPRYPDKPDTLSIALRG